MAKTDEKTTSTAPDEAAKVAFSDSVVEDLKRINASQDRNLKAANERIKALEIELSKTQTLLQSAQAKARKVNDAGSTVLLSDGTRARVVSHHITDDLVKMWRGNEVAKDGLVAVLERVEG